MDQKEFENIEDDPVFWKLLFDFGRSNFNKSDEFLDFIGNWSKNYHNYINSKPWKLLSTKMKEKAGWKCQVCNEDKNLNVHHRTYKRLGCENENDLIVLCAKCHSLFHGVNDG